MTFDIYQYVNEKIIEHLEKGVVPWRKPIQAQGDGIPRNLLSKLAYRGINVFLLAIESWLKGYASSHWITFKQAKQMGGTVRKGEESSLVVFWKWYDTKDKKTGEPTKLPVLRYYRVFNAEQCDGVEAPDMIPLEPLAFTPIQAAQKIVEGYKDGPEIEHGGQIPVYKAVPDRVHLPAPKWYISAEEYYSTLFHELAHSTGHSTRLNRGLDKDPSAFGSQDYSKEELIAEMAAAYLCAYAKIEPVTLKNSAAYIQGWIKALKSDKRMVMHSAAAAQKAADWIRGV